MDKEEVFGWIPIILLMIALFVSGMGFQDIMSKPEIIEVESIRYETVYKPTIINDTQKFGECFQKKGEYKYNMFWDDFGYYIEEKCEF